MTPARSGRGSRWLWSFAGLALVALVLAVVWPELRSATAPSPDQPMAGGFAPAAPGEGQLGPLSGTPREQADRLFNRIMTAQSAGDTVQARFFLPMGLMAYQRVGSLDPDGLYHLALLHKVAGDFAQARSIAEQILARSPRHLLGLAVAAQAARGAADSAAAREYYRRLLDAYDEERERQLPEYRDHQTVLPDYRAEAASYLGR